MIIFDWASCLCDINRDFMMGEFENKKELYMKISEGFEGKYESGVVLKLRKTIYGLK